MDKRNTFIGALLVVAAVAVLIIGQRFAPPPHPSPSEVRQAASQAGIPPQSGPTTLTGTGPQREFETAAADRREAKTATLENGFIRVHFTDSGGAIRDVALKKYPRDSQDDPERFDFNDRHLDPMLAFVEFPGLDRNTRFELVSQTANEVVYRAVLDGQLEVTRRYVIAPDQVGATDPYQLRSETTFRNIAAQAFPAMRVAIAVGTAAPTSLLDNGFQLATGYSNGAGQTFVRRAQLEASNGFLGMVGARGAIPLIEAPGPVVWAATKNQFFTSILTPDQPGAGFVTHRVKIDNLLSDDVRNAYGIAGAAQFDVPALAPGGKTTLGADFYVGPTEYHRLANSDVFKADQDKVMQFGKYIGFFAAILLTVMTKIHAFVPNWGLAIICTTLTLRFAMLAFTIPAARSSRRMQKIQPLLKAVKEKYKDNPQKQQAATLELFKEHKVNPIGGCLPMLFTMPFFFGFFRMLQSAVELRFAPFLWAHDLSAADTVWSIGHGMIPFIGTFKLNILPLLFTATSMVQMRLVPQPSVDNAQMKMMKFMPLMLLFIYYQYSCALSLYSTTNGLFMIGQQLLVNRMRDDGDPTHGKTASGKSLKNVTPKNKR